MTFIKINSKSCIDSGRNYVKKWKLKKKKNSIFYYMSKLNYLNIIIFYMKNIIIGTTAINRPDLHSKTLKFWAIG